MQPDPGLQGFTHVLVVPTFNILRPFPYVENPVCLLKVSGLLHFTKAGCQGLGREQGALLKRSELVTAKIYLINSVEMNVYTFRGSSSLFFFFFFPFDRGHLVAPITTAADDIH